jgi:alpha-N-arabinofuranosidase
MHTGEITILAGQPLGEIRGPLFGQFIELAGRCINNGLYDPESPLARPDGLRPDVVAMLKELRPTHIRYPGGCAAGYFDWQDLAGPRAQRPRARLFRRTELPQSTAFGLPEVHALCREVGAELLYTVNAHTQSPEEAANLVEYLNSDKPTKYADLRRAHGREEPYNVTWFGLGNEIYGDWQPGQKTAPEYVDWCKKAIAEMKAVDPRVKCVVCGLGRPNPEWDRTVLKGLIDKIDYIAIHNYFGRPVFRDNMCASLVCEEMFDQLNVNIDEALDGRLDIRTRPLIAFDEWNVWYRSRHCAEADLEEIFNYQDALTVASILHVILRNVKTVGLANISLFSNTMALVFTDKTRAVRQTIFHPYRLLHDLHTGRVVRTSVDGPVFAGKHERFFCGIVDAEKAKDDSRPSLNHYTDVPALDVLASVDEAARKLRVSVVQKLETEPVGATLRFRGLRLKNAPVRVHRLTGGEDLKAENTLDHPDRVGVAVETVPFSETFTFPPASLTVLEFELA